MQKKIKPIEAENKVYQMRSDRVIEWYSKVIVCYKSTEKLQLVFLIGDRHESTLDTLCLFDMYGRVGV